MRTGGCRCGRLRYEVSGELGFGFPCHCSFCRRTHGSAFTTVAIVPRAHTNTESKAPWFEIADALPQFAAFPAAAELVSLRR